VSNWYYGYLEVRQNKSLIRTICYSLFIIMIIFTPVRFCINKVRLIIAIISGLKERVFRF